MSPQMSEAKKYGFGSDIWAIGCVLYEMVTRRPPFFKSKTFKRLKSNIKHGKYCPVSEHIQKLYSKPLLDFIPLLLNVSEKSRVTSEFLCAHSDIEEKMKANDIQVCDDTVTRLLKKPRKAPRTLLQWVRLINTRRKLPPVVVKKKNLDFGIRRRRNPATPLLILPSIRQRHRHITPKIGSRHERQFRSVF